MSARENAKKTRMSTKKMATTKDNSQTRDSRPSQVSVEIAVNTGTDRNIPGPNPRSRKFKTRDKRVMVVDDDAATQG